MACSKIAQKVMLSFQKDEMTSACLYHYLSKKVKDKSDKKILRQIAEDEESHARIWEHYTQKSIKPNRIKVFFYILLTYLLGYTFVLKKLEIGEYEGIRDLKKVIREIPEVKDIIEQEQRHEKELISMINEERLNYVGAMVLGLNDALVELTGTIAGLTFVLLNNKLVAMAGVITGVAATLSMAASNYLAERADGNPKALTASVYTGISYLVTVVSLVLPYFLFPQSMYLCALISMIAIVIFLIFIFNYYISVVRSERFLPKFIEMSSISLTVAFVSFLIGIGARTFLGIDV